MPSSSATTRGLAAEIAAERKYGLEGAGGPGYADLRAGNGVRYQVKSTVHTRATGQPGRFRFERENFEKLRDSPAGVIFVLFPSVETESRRPLKIKKVPAVRVEQVIDRLGGWVWAGHASFDEQARFEWPEVIDL